MGWITRTGAGLLVLSGGYIWTVGQSGLSTTNQNLCELVNSLSPVTFEGCKVQLWIAGLWVALSVAAGIYLVALTLIWVVRRVQRPRQMPPIDQSPAGQGGGGGIQVSNERIDSGGHGSSANATSARSQPKAYYSRDIEILISALSDMHGVISRNSVVIGNDLTTLIQPWQGGREIDIAPSLRKLSILLEASHEAHMGTRGVVDRNELYRPELEFVIDDPRMAGLTDALTRLRDKLAALAHAGHVSPRIVEDDIQRVYQASNTWWEWAGPTMQKIVAKIGEMRGWKPADSSTGAL